MKKTTAIIIILILAALSTALFVSLGSDEQEAVTSTTQQSTNETSSDEVAEQTPTESYITLDTYQSNKSQYADSAKVLFFHASWCPICQSIDKDITQNPNKIPANTVFIKTDYDKNQDLRQKYGVTYQYTFVSIDNEGNELKQWSATSLDNAVKGLN